MTSGFCFLSQTSEISKFEIRNPKLSWLLAPSSMLHAPFSMLKDGIGHE